MRAMGGMTEEGAARRTPYELIFGAGAFEEEHFPAIRAEAQERGVDATDPERFVMLASVGALLRELPAEGGAAALHELGLLLFHGYHFWRFGRVVYLVERGLVERLAAQPPVVGEWELTPPHPAGYLQLPRNLVWARIGESAPAEPVDGLFWTMAGGDDPAAPPYARLDALLALGLRSDRPGLSVVPVGAPLPDGPGHWADMRARERATGEAEATGASEATGATGAIDAVPAADFANVLPGGELGGLLSLVNEAEVLKLISLLFWHAAAHPGSVVPGASGGAAAGSWGGALPRYVLRDVPDGG